MMHTLIIGGGAAGMAAAIAAARAGQAVTVLERGRRPLKKLGVTGNGRGNLLNAGAPDYPGGADFAAQVLAAMPYERLAAFWEELGVPLRLEEEGRVYPASLLASTAVDALGLAARRLGVEIIVNARVTGPPAGHTPETAPGPALWRRPGHRKAQHAGAPGLKQCSGPR